MAMTILNGATATAVAAAANQQSQCEALIAAWAGGSVTVRVMNGTTLLSTLTHGAWVIGSGTPRTITLGSRLARTFAAAGTPTRVVFRAGSTDIFELTSGVGSGDVSFLAAIGQFKREKIDGVVITAASSLPVGSPPPPPPPPPPPSSPALTFVTGASSGTTGVNAAGPTISAPGTNTAPVAWSLSSTPSGLTATPASGTLAPGASVTPTLNALTAAIYAMTVANGSGGTVNGTAGSASAGNVQFYAPAPPPPPPPPAPVPSGQATGISAVDIVSVVPVPASVGASLWSGSKPWSCGLFFRRGACPAGLTPGAADGSVQVDKFTTWDDGSFKWGRASGVTTAAEIAILTRGTAATGSNVAEPSIAATVAFANVVDAAASPVGGGSFTADIATARTAGAGAWGRTQARLVRSLLGPKMSEFHYYVPTADAHLAVWFYVRAWSDGSAEVETVVENGWTLVASPGRRNYDVTVSVGGSTRYTATGILHYHHTRWSRADWVGTDPVSTMVQSPRSLIASGVVPTFGVDALESTAYSTMPTAGTKFIAWTRDLAEKPAAFNIANHDPNMGSAGHTDAYGVVPEWFATWAIGGHVGAYWSVVANARAQGRYALHYRDEDDGRPARGSYRISMSINDTNSGLSDNSGSSGAVITPAPSGGVGPYWTHSHAPAAAFVGALLTGRWSMVEAQQFQTSNGCFVDMATLGGYRIIGWYAQNRAQAWRFRDFAQCDVLTPSILNGSALTTGGDFDQRTEVVGRIEAQIEEWQNTYVAGSTTFIRTCARGNPLGAPYQNTDFDLFGDTLDGVHGYGGLQNGFYITGALYLFNARPSVGATAQSRLDNVAAHFVKYPIGLLGAAPGSTRDWRVFVHVTTPMGTPGYNGTELLPTVYYSSWDAQYSALQTVKPFAPGTFPLTANSDTFLRRVASDPTSDPIVQMRMLVRTTYVEDTDMIALTWAAQQMHEAAGRVSAPGADLAISRLLTSGTWQNSASSGGIFRTRPGWAMKTSRDLPSWVPATVGVAALVPMTNTLDSVATTGTYTSTAYNLGDYSGGAFNPYYGNWGAMVVHGGGHAGTQDNGVFVADFNTLTWKKDGASTDLSAVGKYVAYSSAVTAGGLYTSSYDYFIRRGPNSTGWAEANVGNSSLFEFPTTWDNPSANPCEITPGNPGSAHTYDSMFILPPAMGGGAKGSLLRAMAFAVGTTTSSSSGFAHQFNLATQSWSRFTAVGAAWATAASAIYDKSTGKAWAVNTGTNISGQWFLDLNTKTWGSVSGNSGIVDDGYIDNVVGCWHAGKALAVHATAPPNGSSGSTRLYWFSTVTAQGTRREVTWTNGSNPPRFKNGGGTLCYIPELDRVFFYTVEDPDAYYLFQVPADPTTAWTWVRNTITGTTPSSLSPTFRGTLYHRMDYSSRLRSVLWVTSQLSGPQFGGRVMAIRIVP